MYTTKTSAGSDSIVVHWLVSPHTDRGGGTVVGVLGPAESAPPWSQTRSQSGFIIPLGALRMCQLGGSWHFSWDFPTFGPTRQNLGTWQHGGGGVYFLKYMGGKSHSGNVWVGGGGRCSHFGAQSWKSDDAQDGATAREPLTIPKLHRRHCCPCPQELEPHWGTHLRACEWARISSMFANPAAGVPSQAPTVC